MVIHVTSMYLTKLIHFLSLCSGFFSFFLTRAFFALTGGGREGEKVRR